MKIGFCIKIISNLFMANFRFPLIIYEYSKLILKKFREDSLHLKCIIFQNRVQLQVDSNYIELKLTTDFILLNVTNNHQ